MKRFCCLICIISLLLTGCSMLGERIKEPVSFYYVRENYQKDMQNVIGSEVREASGHRDDLSYLLALYSMGPSEEGLRSPLPRNTVVTLSEYTDANLELRLSDSALPLSDADFTLASTCVALTCMDLTDAAQVKITCGDREMIIRKDQLLLDSSNAQN